VLAFLQKHFNQILQYKNPAYVFEFIGYEKDDPKLTSDLDKSEVDTWKTLNEKRAEKGAEPIDITKVKNPADLPMNVQAVQMWQSQQGMGGGGESPFGMTDDDFDEGEDAGEGSEGESPEGAVEEKGGPEQTDAGGGGWEEIETQHGGSAVKKSLGGSVRIVI
ncbi:MAG: hypothetical protein LBH73_00780, partial [Spirochaetaceae bacterium]|jgi:hypothetical protein|nr:hypothetical protein [Spirochaetaceae bacterium]